RRPHRICGAGPLVRRAGCGEGGAGATILRAVADVRPPLPALPFPGGAAAVAGSGVARRPRRPGDDPRNRILHLAGAAAPFAVRGGDGRERQEVMKRILVGLVIGLLLLEAGRRLYKPADEAAAAGSAAYRAGDFATAEARFREAER